MTKNILTKKIEVHQSGIEECARSYIGASIIGSECLRAIWYELHETPVKKIPTKTWRTWQIGKKLESLIMDWLDDAGISLGSFPKRTLQSKRVSIFQGHVDSVWIGKKGVIKAIIEVKTAKDASFKVFVKKGLKLWNPQYYAQIQSYMGMSDIHSTYIVVLNKDNSEISDELITFDEKFYKQLEDKAFLVSTAVSPPPRIHGSPLWYQCKMCKFNKICHEI